MEEMDVSSKRVKRIVRNPDLRRVCHSNRWMVTRDDEPRIAVVYMMDETEAPLVITVLVRSYEEYAR